MSGLPLVSIITPSLNQGRFIEDTITSVLSQDYPHLEYIVVDGGSTDGTLDVLKRYEGRLSWVSEPDRGQSHAVNKGFRQAKGEILAWLNSDDTYLPGAVGAAVEHLLQRPDCAVVYGDGYLIDERGARIRRFPATEPFNLWKLVYVSDYILQQTAFFRRDMLASVGYLDENLHWAMDWDVFVRIGKRLRVDYLPRDMANLREYPSAKTLSGGRRRLKELIAVMRRHGVRSFPPGVLTYGIDTYFRVVFAAIERACPDRLAGPMLTVQRLLERPVYGLVAQIIREAQGLYSDGWVSRRAHFLLPTKPNAKLLMLRGTLPAFHRGARPLRLAATANGVILGTRSVATPGDFDVAWEIPPTLREGDVLEVRFDCHPTFKPSRVPFRGDRRRLAFQLRTISLA